jgi:hypothetical protein
MRWADADDDSLKGSIADKVRKRRFPIVGDGGGINSFIHVEDGRSSAERLTLRDGHFVP